MIIRTEQCDCRENELILRYRELDDECLEILSLLRERSTKIAASLDGTTYLIRPGDIFYAESVDGRTFIYTAKQVLETPHSLNALQIRSEGSGLVRIAKSQLVNLYQVSTLRSLPNTRIEVTLKNNERLIVSRHYVQDFKAKLGL